MALDTHQQDQANYDGQIVAVVDREVAFNNMSRHSGNILLRTDNVAALLGVRDLPLAEHPVGDAVWVCRGDIVRNVSNRRLRKRLGRNVEELMHDGRLQHSFENPPA